MRQGENYLCNGEIEMIRMVKRRCATISIRKFEKLAIVGRKRERNMPKKYWRKVIESRT